MMLGDMEWVKGSEAPKTSCRGGSSHHLEIKRKVVRSWNESRDTLIIWATQSGEMHQPAKNVMAWMKDDMSMTAVVRV
jgi:hypothetical protein